MRTALMTLLICGFVSLPAVNGADDRDELRRDFQIVVSPFVRTYCIGCHGKEKPKAKFNLTPYVSMESVAGDLGHWEIMLKRLRAGEMPPEKARKFPDDKLRRRIIDWIGGVDRGG